MADKGTGVLAGSVGSKWDGMSRHLLASLHEVDIDGNAIGDVELQAPFVEDVQLDLEMNWQSPFEGAGAEGAAPALSSMLQSGTIPAIVDKVGQQVGTSAFDDPSGSAREAIGRSGMTKLNSTQIFNGMPPLRIQGELLFRAWSDPQSEVEAPIDQLVQWALPEYLAPEGTMITAVLDYATSDKGMIESAFPSIVPAMVALTYKGRTYSPMVIERVGVPLGSPIDKHGRFTQMKVPITLATLTGKDRKDWMAMKG